MPPSYNPPEASQPGIASIAIGPIVEKPEFGDQLLRLEPCQNPANTLVIV